jgi:hypothetical protein
MRGEADGGFRYLYTTMSDEGLEAAIESSDFKAPMAGFGCVLSILDCELC